MAGLTQDDLLQQAAEITNETQEGANTAERVGTMLTNIIEFIGENLLYTDPAKTGTAWSNLPAGSDITGKPLAAIIKQAVSKAFAAAGVSLQGGGLYEKGTTAAVSLVGTISPNDDTVSSRRLLRNGVAIVPAPTTNNVALNENRTTATTYKLEAVTVASGVRSSGEVRVDFVAASFYGTVASSSPGAAEVKSLSRQIWPAAGRQLAFNCNGTRPCFAEPQANGVRNLIKDKNGFNITNDVIRTALQIELPDHTAQTPSLESYWIYTHKNPQTDAAFIFSL